MSTPDYIGMVTADPEDRLDYGVKGMKWGVRKDPGHEGERAKTKTIEKLDKKFDNEIARANAGKGMSPAMRNAFVTRLNDGVRQLNDSDKYRTANLNDPDSSIRKQYDNDMQDLIARSVEGATNQIYGSNASGTKRATYNRKTDQFEVVDQVVKHSDTSEVPDFIVKVVRDGMGKIVESTIEIPDAAIEHSDDVPDYIGMLQVDPDDRLDYGVPGMKWGQRKSKAQLKADAEKRSAESSGNSAPKKPPANETHSQKYDRLKAEAKAGRADQLSDDDLRWFNARTDALARINKLNQKDPDWLKKTSKQVLQEVAKESMKAVVGAGTVSYISGPIIDAIKSKK